MKTLPRFPLAHLPTPLEPMPSLSKALGGPELWVKRDDQTGLAFGGNKTRKLEYLLADAQAEGADTLITAGAIQSNHCRQTAAAARRAGMHCILVLGGDEPERPEANTYLDLLLGAEIIWTPAERRGEQLERVMSESKEVGRSPYIVPYGGSSRLGAAGYAYAIQELQHQKTDFDWIVFATSSGGTQGGMIAGAELFTYDARILGISVDEAAEDVQDYVSGLAGRTTELMGAAHSFKTEDVLVNDDYLGGGYAVMGAAEKEAIQLFAHHEGLLVDPVYTGRAAAGLIDLVRKGFFDKKDKVLFWHTGGSPALFAEGYQADLLST
ncbi:MAG: D-cysteine desulfhydrase family protein [Chloroflexi bacterium]|nr:MAG: D-cysteine desulfhydrase family protein [Chloroflexota bacterium]MBL1195301.1 D-cysteine desulfhydrase family protein [Chloroflexota bacterium]NOH12585.1 D-cysteine desulfhydrase family protein [Chloroflexota bacterium]